MKKVLLAFLFTLLACTLASADSALTLSQTVSGCKRASATLLDGANGVTAGQWTAIEGWQYFSVHFSGIGTATANLRVSNSPIKPQNNDNEITAGSVSADGFVSVSTPARWVKADISAYTSGQVFAWLEGLVCQ